MRGIAADSFLLQNFPFLVSWLPNSINALSNFRYRLGVVDSTVIDLQFVIRAGLIDIDETFAPTDILPRIIFLTLNGSGHDRFNRPNRRNKKGVRPLESFGRFAVERTLLVD